MICKKVGSLGCGRCGMTVALYAWVERNDRQWMKTKRGFVARFFCPLCGEELIEEAPYEVSFTGSPKKKNIFIRLWRSLL